MSAGGYIQALLYAAAISNLPISKCYEWSVSPRKALEAADLIREHTGEREMLRWADTIRGLETMDTRQRSSELVRREERVRDPRGPEGAFDDGFLAARPASDRSEAHGRGS